MDVDKMLEEIIELIEKEGITPTEKEKDWIKNRLNQEKEKKEQEARDKIISKAVNKVLWRDMFRKAYTVLGIVVILWIVAWTIIVYG